MDDGGANRADGRNLRLRFSLKRLALSMSLFSTALWILICFDRLLPSEKAGPLIYLPTFFGLLALLGALIGGAILILLVRAEK